MQLTFAVLLVFMSFLAGMAHSQANFASETMELTVPLNNLPIYWISSLNGVKVVQETVITLISIAEFAFQGELPIYNSTLVPGSMMQSSALTWTSSYSQDNTQSFAQANISCASTNRPSPTWDSMMISLTWSNIPTSDWLTMDLIVDNYQWVDNSSSTTLSFMFGFASPNISNSVLPVINPATTASYGVSYFTVNSTASVVDPSDPTINQSPVWLWLNENTLIVSIGSFEGSVGERVVVGVNSGPAPSSTPTPNSPDFGLDFGIFVVGVLVIGVVAVVMLIGGAFYLGMKSRKPAYEPI